MAPKENTALNRDKKKNAVTKEIKSDMKRLHEQSRSKDEIYKFLNLGLMPRSTFYNCLKYKDNDSEVKHKVRNHFVADSQKAFEADFCNLYRKRAEKRGFGKELLAECAREIRQENEIYNKDELISKLKLSSRYIDAAMKRNRLIFTYKKPDSINWSEDQVNEFRAGLEEQFQSVSGK